MFYFYPTPEHIVENIVKRHSPSKFASVLEPSIGDGALLKALNTLGKKITCVDINSKRLSAVDLLQNSQEFKLIHSDFLNVNFKEEKFDLILCNPPFDGKKQYIFANKTLPIEAAFLKKSLELCREDGRLIFILPSSVTRGTRLKWFREYILDNYCLSYSYKLPKFTFKKVEGNFSVLIIDKKKKNNVTIFRNEKSEVKVKSLFKVTNNISFDADEIIAAKNYRSLIKNTALDLIPIDKLFSFQRGDIKSDYKRLEVLHTTNASQNLKASPISKLCVESGDWIIKRVSRDLTNSLREYAGNKVSYTDCIIRIKSIDNNFTYRNFFSLSVMLQVKDFCEVITKGSGAKYLDFSTFKKIQVPINLHLAYDFHYRCFINANDNERIEIARKVAFIFINMAKTDHVYFSGLEDKYVRSVV